jgi:hypothetical protein
MSRASSMTWRTIPSLSMTKVTRRSDRRASSKTPKALAIACSGKSAAMEKVTPQWSAKAFWEGNLSVLEATICVSSFSNSATFCWNPTSSRSQPPVKAEA